MAWESYEWALETAKWLGVAEISIVASSYESFAVLDLEIGEWEVEQLRAAPHRYRIDGLTVRGVERHQHAHPRGVVLLDRADDHALAAVERHHPAAVAAVAQRPEDIAAWRTAHLPVRIGRDRSAAIGHGVRG